MTAERTNGKKVLLIGNGGRENALAWKITQSAHVEKLFTAPGNPGTAKYGENIPLAIDDFEGLKNFVLEKGIDLTIVGPEMPLCEGIVDVFQAAGLRIFGPARAAAELEGSKAFAKNFMLKYGIPTARYAEYSDCEAAKAALPSFGLPVVIKADGLAAGKGVIIAQTLAEAEETVADMMLDKKFGDSGNKVVIEAFLTGIEASMICFVDGEHILPMEAAQDYKKAYDGDLGLNTGGMGAYSPSILFDEKLMKTVDEKVLQPFISGVRQEGMNFKGMIFIGLMIEDGDVQVIEFNTRFGDPETQVLLSRLENDLVEVFEMAIDGRLNEVELLWTKDKCVTVVLASQGYPDDYPTGFEITGLEAVKESVVFHAGTKFKGDQVVTSGGRVMTVTAMGTTLEEARGKIYRDISKLHFEGMQYRKDIAKF